MKQGSDAPRADRFSFCINAHSEKSRKLVPLSIKSSRFRMRGLSSNSRQPPRRADGKDNTVSTLLAHQRNQLV